MALGHFGVDGSYYVDFTEKEILQKKETFGKTYLVEESLPPNKNGKLILKVKKLGEYKVYQASTTKIVVNSKGTFESEVIAWFAPEIPFSFGPVGYGGLPGLILEVEEKTNFPVRYFAKTVEFQKEEISIDVLSRVKKITAKELDNMYNEASGKMREFHSGNSGN